MTKQPRHTVVVSGGEESLTRCLSSHLVSHAAGEHNSPASETGASQPELGRLGAEPPRKLGPRLRCQGHRPRLGKSRE